MITDWDIKKSYVNYSYGLYGMPLIFIDDYWDYYINQLGKESEWNKFKDNYKSDGFTSYNDFCRKIYTLVEKCACELFNTTQSNVFNKLIEIRNDIVEWTDLPSIKEANELLKQEHTHQSLRIKVDLIAGGEQALKYAGVFNDNYESTYDIINKMTDYETFKNNKKIRLLIFYKNLLGAYDSMGDILKQINKNILLKKLYESDNDIIKKLNSTGLAYKSDNDCLMYNIAGIDDPMSLIGDNNIDGLGVHIDLNESKSFLIQNQSIFITRKNKSQLLVNPKYPFLFPLCASLYNGQTPTEKDLAIGYEDKIFFHLNENDYEKL
jgi:hypothetical protein